MPWNTRSKTDLSGYLMSRILITGSTDGLGRAAAGALIDDGHDVVLHARTRERAASVAGLAPGAAGVVIGDLASAAETRALAGRVNDIGRMNAGRFFIGFVRDPSRQFVPVQMAMSRNDALMEYLRFTQSSIFTSGFLSAITAP